MVFTGQGIITGALTTAGAFLAMGLTNFKGIQEMGIISGGGLVLCLVPMMTLLPVLLMRGKRQNALDAQPAALEARRARLEELWLRRPVWVVIAAVALCGAAATQFHKVYFDYNLLNMQSRGLASVALRQEAALFDQQHHRPFHQRRRLGDRREEVARIRPIRPFRGDHGR